MKRFHETNKWDDPWFAALPAKEKLAWDYVLSKCDNAGVWSPNTQLADFQIGAKIDWAKCVTLFAKNLRVLSNGKWWVPSFIQFQYGKLSEDARVHQSVMKLIEAHGLSAAYAEWSEGKSAIPSLSHSYVIPMTCSMSQGQEKEKEQGQEKGQIGGGASVDDEFERVWSLYPKKKGKQEAKPVILAAIKAKGAPFLIERVGAYASAVAQWSADDRRFIPDPVRWFRRGQFEDDPATWVRDTAPLFRVAGGRPELGGAMAR